MAFTKLSLRNQPDFFVQGSFNITKKCPWCWHFTTANENEIYEAWDPHCLRLNYVFFCDHKKCGKEQYVEKDEMPPMIPQRILDRSGSFLIKVYICPECIVPRLPKLPKEKYVTAKQMPPMFEFLPLSLFERFKMWCFNENPVPNRVRLCCSICKKYLKNHRIFYRVPEQVREKIQQMQSSVDNTEK